MTKKPDTRIIKRLKNKKLKGYTIVKQSQMEAYCKEFVLDLKEQTLALLNTGRIVKYSKRFPYRFNH